ncbi:hypothetical protein E1A91_D02G082700v1 [Gossypium mustelinum]|uniref:Uncharacterized protein n=1 Tax=Gossypium mustelinum TaxID=34275 RepID=A0A5D2VT16_GOSMU|nr:hypothetical protein E1A91_D02G082700v1 [Gossypium mustelinum]
MLVFGRKRTNYQNFEFSKHILDEMIQTCLLPRGIPLPLCINRLFYLYIYGRGAHSILLQIWESKKFIKRYWEKM